MGRNAVERRGTKQGTKAGVRCESTARERLYLYSAKGASGGGNGRHAGGTV